MKERQKLLQELAPMVMKAKKKSDLPFASWRSRKAGGTIQSEAKDLRTWGPLV